MELSVKSGLCYILCSNLLHLLFNFRFRLDLLLLLLSIDHRILVTTCLLERWCVSLVSFPNLREVGIPTISLQHFIDCIETLIDEGRLSFYIHEYRLDEVRILMQGVEPALQVCR